MENEIKKNEWDGVERRKNSGRRGRDKWFRRVVIIWIILFTGVTGYAIRIQRENANDFKHSATRLAALSIANKQRISDIQQSRLESCKSTYNSFHTVFDPFFPPKTKRTEKQKKDLLKFNRIIAKKVRECRVQVSPPPIPKNGKNEDKR